MEQAFAENARETAGLEKAVAARSVRWPPKGMEFEEANFVDEMMDAETPSDSGEKGDSSDDLPAFLAETDAA